MKGSDKKRINLEFWNKIFGKMNVLFDIMTESKGNYDIDDPEVRWVTDRIEYFNSEERILTKREMRIANDLWIQYNGPHNVVRNG